MPSRPAKHDNGRAPSLEQELRKHIQELQDLLAEEEASQREWRAYAESKNVEALAAEEAMESLKKENGVLMDYTAALESDIATLKAMLEEMQQQPQQPQRPASASARATTSAPSSPAPAASPRSPGDTPAAGTPSTSATKGSDWKLRMLSPPSPAYVPATLHQQELAARDREIEALKEQLQQVQDSEAFLKEQLAKAGPQGNTLALATLNCGSAQLRQHLLQAQAGLEAPPASRKGGAAQRVDESALRQQLWQYAGLLEEEKAVLEREMDEFQTSWLAAEERCSGLRQELEETRAALCEAVKKEELLQQRFRRMERLTMADGDMPSPAPLSPPRATAPPALPPARDTPSHPISPPASLRASTSSQLDLPATDVDTDTDSAPSTSGDGWTIRRRHSPRPLTNTPGPSIGTVAQRSLPEFTPGGYVRGATRLSAGSTPMSLGGLDLQGDCDAVAAALLAPTPVVKGGCGGVAPRMPGTPDLLADSATAS